MTQGEITSITAQMQNLRLQSSTVGAAETDPGQVISEPVARLAGLDVPKWDDNAATIAELRARIQKTIDYVKTIPASQGDGSEGREITIPMRSGDALKYKGEVYLKEAALPNFFFHATTAYALLRHAGVDVGKGDYLGR